jgi:hypothetical protein
VALPACCCTRPGVWHSLPDLWQSAGVWSSLPVTLIELNTIVTGVRRSLPVTAQDQVCGTPCLTCGRALVCSISLPVTLSRTNTLEPGVQCSLTVAAKGQVCRNPCLFLWKCACVNALVIVRLFATNKSYIGAVPLIKSVQCTYCSISGLK